MGAGVIWRIRTVGWMESSQGPMCIMAVRPFDPDFEYPSATHIRHMAELPTWIQKLVLANQVCTGRWDIDGAKDLLQWHSKE